MAKYTPSTPTRALNTNFTPNANFPTWVSYSIAIAATATLTGNQQGTVELRSDSAATPTTVRGTASAGVNLALGVAITFTNSQTCQLSYLVPPGHNVRLVSSVVGTPTISIVSQVEVVITPEFDGVDFATKFPFK